MSLDHLKALFAVTRAQRKHTIANANRLNGANCTAKMLRGQAKRIKAGKTPYLPR